MEQFLKRKKAPYWMVLAATILAIGEFIIYLLAGRTQFDPNYSWAHIIGSSIAVLFGVVSIVRTYRVIIFSQFFFQMFSLITYVTSQIQLIANIIYSVDGSVFPLTFFLSIIFAFVSCCLIFVAGILSSSSGGMLDVLYLKEEKKND